MYRTIRHGKVEPVVMKRIIRRLLLALGVLFIITAAVLFVLWRKALPDNSYPPSIATSLCTGTDMRLNDPASLNQTCTSGIDPTLPGKYAHVAIAACAAGAVALIGGFMLGLSTRSKK